MPLVYILAQSPWGPVQLRAATDAGEVLRECAARGSAPAQVIDVGGRDPAEVVKVATRAMQPVGSGWFAESVAKAANLVAVAVSEVPAAMVVAGTPEIAVLSHPATVAGHMEGVEEGAEAGPELSEATRASAREVVAVNDDTGWKQLRPGAEVDAKAIRAGLGLSQPAFAAAFGLKLAVLRDWEQGRTKPDGAAKVLLRVIEAKPDAVREVVAADRGKPVSHFTTAECR